jgi:GTP-binding protein of the ras superfamily involved in termination of M-phase
LALHLYHFHFAHQPLQTAHAFLIGTKYDIYTTLPVEEIEEIDKLARKYAKAMKAPLIFSSASNSINVQKMFKIVLSKVFDLKSTVAEIDRIGEPLLIFQG